MGLYEMLFGKKKRLFREYISLVKENNSTIMYRLSEEKAEAEFNESFLESLIFSEKLKSIIKIHQEQIQKEISDIYPDDKQKREDIYTLCGKQQSIVIQFKQGYSNELEVYNHGIA